MNKSVLDKIVAAEKAAEEKRAAKEAALAAEKAAKERSAIKIADQFEEFISSGINIMPEVIDCLNYKTIYFEWDREKNPISKIEYQEFGILQASFSTNDEAVKELRARGYDQVSFRDDAVTTAISFEIKK